MGPGRVSAVLRVARWPLLVAVLAGVYHGGLAIRAFPAELQLYKYPIAAAQMRAGALPPERVVDFSPGYLYLHAAVAWVAGDPPPGSPVPVTAVIVLQVVAVSAATALLLLLLARFFPPWVALAGALAFVLGRGVTIYTSVLEPEAFLLLGLVVFLCFSALSQPKAQWLAGFGLALALSLRPSALPLLAVVPFHVRLNEDRKSWAGTSARLLLPGLLVLLAVGVRNGLASGYYSPLGMNPGFVFFEGNNPLSSGRSAVYPPLVAEVKYESGAQPDSPHLAYRMIAERSSGRGLSVWEANDFWRGKAIAFIADHPGRALRLLVTKAYLTFHGYRRHDLVPAERYDSRLGELRIPALPYGLLSALALIGLVVSMRDWRRRLLLYALFLSQATLMVLLYVSERQRIAFVPVFIFFGCAALHEGWKRGWRARSLLAAATFAMAVGFTVPNYLIREERHVWAAYEARDPLWSQAFRLRDEGRLGEASRAAVLAHSAAPWLRDYARPARLPFDPGAFEEDALAASASDDAAPSRLFDRAQLLMQAGRFEEAERELRRLVATGARFDRGFLHSSQPAYYLARIAAAEGRHDEALLLLRRAAEKAPGDPFVLADLAALTAEGAEEEALARYFSELDARFLVGMAQLQHGTADRGAARLAEVVRRLPELWRVRVYLSVALAANGDLESAVATYREAMAIRDDPVLLEDRVVPMFAAAAERAPADARMRYEYAMVLAQFGRFDAALAALHAARELEDRPELERALMEIGRLRDAAAAR